MTAEHLFASANTVALLTWVLLIVFPRRHVIVTGVAGAATPLLLAAAYVVLIAVSSGASDGGFSSLADVRTLFGSEWLLLAGWIHYLAFDLLVGRWELIDSQSRGMPHLLVVPCLLLTFLFGPGGWLLYMVLRSGWTRRSVASAR